MSNRLPDTTARAGPENLTILMREPFRLVTAAIVERFAACGHPQVRAVHGNVLQFLDDGGTRVGVLAQRAQITKQSMAELVAHLEQLGYVERVPDPSDGRAKLVRATDRGRELYAIARAVIQEIQAGWSARLGPAKVQQLRELLEELNALL